MDRAVDPFAGTLLVELGAASATVLGLGGHRAGARLGAEATGGGALGPFFPVRHPAVLRAHVGVAEMLLRPLSRARVAAASGLGDDDELAGALATAALACALGPGVPLEFAVDRHAGRLSSGMHGGVEGRGGSGGEGRSAGTRSLARLGVEEVLHVARATVFGFLEDTAVTAVDALAAGGGAAGPLGPLGHLAIGGAVLLTAGADLHEDGAFGTTVEGDLLDGTSGLDVARAASLRASGPGTPFGDLAVNLGLLGAVELAAREERAALIVVLVDELAGATLGGVRLAGNLLAVLGERRGVERRRDHGGALGRFLSRGVGRGVGGGRSRRRGEAKALGADGLAALLGDSLGGLGTGHEDTRVVLAGTLGAEAGADSTTDLGSTSNLGHVVTVVESEAHLVGRSVVVHGGRALQGRSAGIHGVHETDAVGGHTVSLGKGDAAGSGLPRAKKFETLLLLVRAEDERFHGNSLLEAEELPATADEASSKLVVVETEVNLVSGEGATGFAIRGGNFTVFALLAGSLASEVLVLASITLVAMTTVGGRDELAVHASRADTAFDGAVSLLLAVLTNGADQARLLAVVATEGTFLGGGGADRALVTGGAALSGLELASRTVVAGEGTSLRLVATSGAVEASRVFFGGEFTSATLVALAVACQLGTLLGSVAVGSLLAGVALLAGLGAIRIGIAASRAGIARVKAFLGLKHTSRAVPALVLAFLGLPLARGAGGANNATLVDELALGAVQRLVASTVLRIFVAVIAAITNGGSRAFHAVVTSLVRTPIVGIGTA